MGHIAHLNNNSYFIVTLYFDVCSYETLKKNNVKSNAYLKTWQYIKNIQKEAYFVKKIISIRFKMHQRTNLIILDINVLQIIT